MSSLQDSRLLEWLATTGANWTRVFLAPRLVRAKVLGSERPCLATQNDLASQPRRDRWHGSAATIQRCSEGLRARPATRSDPETAPPTAQLPGATTRTDRHRHDDAHRGSSPPRNQRTCTNDDHSRRPNPSAKISSTRSETSSADLSAAPPRAWPATRNPPQALARRATARPAREALHAACSRHECRSRPRHHASPTRRENHDPDPPRPPPITRRALLPITVRARSTPESKIN